MRKKSTEPTEIERVGPHLIIKQLRHAPLKIHTIPGEEWTLSCRTHETLLVEVYSLSGHIHGTIPVTYHCGRLCEVLLKLLYSKREVTYTCHIEKPEESNVIIPHISQVQEKTYEGHVRSRLYRGDIFFHCIPGERWRLSTNDFGLCSNSLGTVTESFRIAEQSTFGTPSIRMFRGIRLEYVLLDFLLQDVTFADEYKPTNVLEFRQRGAK